MLVDLVMFFFMRINNDTVKKKTVTSTYLKKRVIDHRENSRTQGTKKYPSLKTLER